MHDITPDAVVIGIDTHKDVHVAVAINGLGARLATASFPVTSKGYRQVATWATEHGTVHAFGIEGTGSYGAGLARALVAKGLRVIEVGRINRQLRRRHGKTDTVDAESAARAVLAGDADGEPKLGDGTVEMIRHLKIARDTALKARTQAMVTLKTMLVNAPQALRERFICITGKMTLIRAIAALRPGALVSTTASAKMALRALANRWLMLDAEIKEHEAVLEQLVRAHAPALMDAPGVSTGTIADMLIVLGDNPQHPIRGRVRQAMRRVPCAGIKWQDQPSPAQPRWQPTGECGSVPRRLGSHAPPSADPRIYPAPNRRRQVTSRNPAVPQALHRSRNLPTPLH
jgi:transposase